MKAHFSSAQNDLPQTVLCSLHFQQETFPNWVSTNMQKCIVDLFSIYFSSTVGFESGCSNLVVLMFIESRGCSHFYFVVIKKKLIKTAVSKLNKSCNISESKAARERRNILIICIQHRLSLEFLTVYKLIVHAVFFSLT